MGVVLGRRRGVLGAVSKQPDHSPWTTRGLGPNATPNSIPYPPTLILTLECLTKPLGSMVTQMEPY